MFLAGLIGAWGVQKLQGDAPTLGLPAGHSCYACAQLQGLLVCQ